MSASEPSMDAVNRRRAAIEAFIAALGSDNVTESSEALAEFLDPFARDTSPNRAVAMVSPASSHEVQQVVRIANEFGVPLWTFSQGRNNGYGGAAPRVPGSVLVNLRRMNRVLEISEDHAYAVVEPGVRFIDLYERLRAEGHRLWTSIPDLGWGSVMGNTLDHGIGYLGQDHPSRASGMEVVLADGEILRTGMGAMDSNRSWHTHQRGFGPTADGIFMQSNFGIVTRMGIWLVPEPETYAACWLSVPEVGDLEQLVDVLRPLMLDGTISNSPALGSSFFVATMVGDDIGNEWVSSSRNRWYDADGPMPDEAIARMARDLGIGRWNMRFALYGRTEIVKLKLKIVREAFSAIEGAHVRATLYEGATVAEHAKSQADRVQGGVPSMDMTDQIEWFGGATGGHLDFSTVAPLSGVEATRHSEILKPIIERNGFDYDPSMVIGPRSLTHVTPLWFDTTDEEQVNRAYDTYAELLLAAADAGYGVYRTHIEFMDLAADSYDFNLNAARRFNEKLKDALDPNGILSPGKQGIWPRSLRESPRESVIDARRTLADRVHNLPRK